VAARGRSNGGEDMRNQALGVAVVAVLVTAVVVVVALVAFNTGTNHPAGPAARPGSGAPARPTPSTTTVTKHEAPPADTEAPPRPQYGGDDQEFLAMIADDGIRAPDDWAIEAGRKTCGRSYDYAYNYLTDGGIYGYHVQTFLDDWKITHPGC
jgi:hypothetical protein